MGASEPQPMLADKPGSRHVDAADVVALLREVYADGIATREEAEELISFDHTLTEATSGWTEFFSNTIADHVLRRRAPEGAVDAEAAAWLIGLLGRGRQTATAGGFAAIVRLIETANDIAPVLSAYAIRQVRSAVLAHRRPASTVRLFLNRAIDSETAVLVRRVVLGCAGQSARPVSREEAEALFDLHDLTARATNDEDFDDLFFKAVAHHVLGAAGAPVPGRREALARHSRFPDAEMRAFPLRADENAWLASQIMRDGRPTEAEFKLLQFFAWPAADAALHDAIRAA